MSKKKIRKVHYFEENRAKVQRFYQSSQYFTELTEESLPIRITESTDKRSAKLQEVIIENFPVSDKIRPISWLLNLELKKALVAKIEQTKTTEAALLLFHRKELIVFMIEMKSTIQNKEIYSLKDIETKLKHTIGRIAIFLTSYLFIKKDIYKDVKVVYKGLIFHNKNELETVDTDFIENNLLYGAFSGSKNKIKLDASIIEDQKVEIFFIQNKDPNAKKLYFDFLDFFAGREYATTDLTFPDDTNVL